MSTLIFRCHLEFVPQAIEGVARLMRYRWQSLLPINYEFFLGKGVVINLFLQLQDQVKGIWSEVLDDISILSQMLCIF